MALPEPSFIERDPIKVTAENIALYEAESGKTLQPAQQEMLMVNQISYRESLLRIAIQEAAKQNLVNYANYPMLDHLGALVGAERLPAQPALTTVRFTLSELLGFDLVIPQSTLIGTADGQQTFVTTAPLTIPGGSLSGDISAQAETAGELANNYQPGTVNDLLSPVPYVAEVANITATAGGFNEEKDDQLRERVKMAPESFSVAGSRNAYIYWARTAHQSIVDVAPVAPGEGIIHLYPLLATGQPTQEILNAVEQICSAETVRPLSDSVVALPPVRKTSALVVELIVYDTADPVLVQAASATALTDYAAWLRSKLGRDAIIERIIAVASVPGVYKATVPEPVTDIVNDDSEWLDITAVTVTVTGMVKG